MTRIKYATIGHARESDRLLVLRGKKEGQVGFLPDEDDGNPFGNPLYSERVVELPDRMTPTEYDEYIKETVVEGSDDPVTAALRDVAAEKGIDLWEDALPAAEGGEDDE